jgi:hypothetical protein
MTRLISKDDVTLETIAALMAEIGYEPEVDTEDEQVILRGSGNNCRLQLHPTQKSIRIRTHLWLNPSLKDAAVRDLLFKLNDIVYVTKFTHHRWGADDLLLLGSHVVHYAFGLQVDNFLYVLRRILESHIGVYYEYIKSTPYAPPDTDRAESDNDEGDLKQASAGQGSPHTTVQ